MRKTFYFLFAVIAVLAGCSDEKTTFTLKGEISGMSSDTLLVYYQVPEYKLDTIFCQKGIFEYTIEPDTTTMFSLIFNAEESLPVFAEKGQTVQVKGSVQEPEIQGKGDNKLMDEILSLLKKTPEEVVKQVVDSLIRTNARSFTNLYLIDKYYTTQEQVGYNHLKDLIENQSGIIKDTPYMMYLQPKVENLSDGDKPRNVHSLQVKDRDGKDFKWNDIRDKYILLSFWASWHPESVAEQDSLQTVIKALKKEKFVVCSISLDLDKDAWLESSDRDTTQWKQLCDFKGWNQPVVKNQDVQTLPANLLLNKSKRIIARDLRGQELIDKVKELIKKDKEEEKEKITRKRKK